MIFQWLSSRAVRQAFGMCGHAQKILNHQRDILAPKAVDEIEVAIAAVREAIKTRADRATIENRMEDLEKVANKWLKPYPNAAWRENVEVLLVALAVAMAIRTFFLQPFKIPTGSMQPTLFGVVSTNLINQPDVRLPTGADAVKQWFQGVSYIHKVAAKDGTLEVIDEPFRILIFNIWQRLVVGGKTYMIWFPPDYGSQDLRSRASLNIGQFFSKGEDILRLKVIAGDHLFVDRVTYNFRP